MGFREDTEARFQKEREKSLECFAETNRSSREDPESGMKRREDNALTSTSLSLFDKH